MSKLNTIKEILINFLKGEAIKIALKNILGSVAMGGFKAWLIKFIVTELYEELGEPLIRAGINQVGYYYDKIDGKITIKKIDKAREEGDAENYRDGVNDIFTK